MAVTYSLGPNPKWYFVNLNGKPLSGGFFNTYSSVTHNRKFVYSDISGPPFNYPNPISIDANGTLGPIYFSFDPDFPKDGYFIVVTDADGNQIWAIDNYFPNTGGGGSVITTNLNLENLITNNVLFRHTDDSITDNLPVLTKIAPSNFAGLSGYYPIEGQTPSEDIVFVKDQVSPDDRDEISFPLFSPLGTEPINGNLAPVDYFLYTCTMANPLQMVKCLQFPIVFKVQNLQAQTVSGSIWLYANGVAPQNVTLNLMQWFGDGGGASAPEVIETATFTLLNPNTWQKVTYSVVVPSVTGQTLGMPNFQGPNDGLFFQVQFPLTETCSIGVTKPTMYLGTAIPQIELQTYDEIGSIISQPRTGDVRISLNAFAPFGWVACNDGVISNGSLSIIAPAGIPIARNNIDTYTLYTLMWHMFFGNQSYAPMYSSTGSGPIGYGTTAGSTAIDDFQAGNQIQLTKVLGRALSSAGMASGQTTNWNLGQSPVGTETHTLAANDLPPHTHPFSTPIYYGLGGLTGSSDLPVRANSFTTQLTIGPNSTTNNPISLFQPTSFWNVFLKL